MGSGDLDGNSIASWVGAGLRLLRLVLLDVRVRRRAGSNSCDAVEQLNEKSVPFVCGGNMGLVKTR